MKLNSIATTERKLAGHRSGSDGSVVPWSKARVLLARRVGWHDLGRLNIFMLAALEEAPTMILAWTLRLEF